MAAPSQKLTVFYKDHIVGQLSKDSDDFWSFQYENSWLSLDSAFAISFTMPLSHIGPFSNRITKSFFENLLPEGMNKDRINQSFRDIAKDGFKFLTTFGLDCAGALTISSARSNSAASPGQLTEIPVGEIDRTIRESKDLFNFTHKKYHSRFSLAGAQEKAAIVLRGKKIFIPTGEYPSTHILKIPIRNIGNGVDSVYNEFFCMKLARSIGFYVPKVQIISGEFPYFIVDRFDRYQSEDRVHRIHQFDFCQALGYLPTQKYEEDGGPPIREHYRAIIGKSQVTIKDALRYLDWIAFNLIIGNNDCHSKNISIIYSPEGYTLAPFYDLISTAVYPRIDGKFAIAIGKPGRGQFLWYKLRPYHFHGVERQIGLREGVLLKRFTKVADKVRKALPKQKKNMDKQFGSLQITRKIELEISKRLRIFKQHKIIA